MISSADSCTRDLFLEISDQNKQKIKSGKDCIELKLLLLTKILPQWPSGGYQITFRNIAVPF